MAFASSRLPTAVQQQRSVKPVTTAASLKAPAQPLYNENAHRAAVRKEASSGMALRDISNTAAVRLSAKPSAAPPMLTTATTRPTAPISGAPSMAAALCGSLCAPMTSTVAPFSGSMVPMMPQTGPTTRIDDDNEDMSVDSLANMSLEDIDEFDRDDPQFVTDYVKEIFAYLRVKEAEDRVNSEYMAVQKDLRATHRHILVNWMAEVYVKFSLLSETMFLAVNIIDRFLSMRQVSRGNFQLVGITAMLVACKYEEIYSPQVKDFLYVCDRAYETDDVLRMEQIILSTLDFNLATPSPLHFLRRFSKAGRADSKTHTLSKYLTELTMSEYGMLKYLPSEIAAAAVYTARRMREISPRWNSTLRYHTGYDEAHIAPIARELNAVLAQANAKPTAVVRKYTSSKLLAVAKIPPVAF